MEPLSVTIATALALGAAAGVKELAEKTVLDAYAGLKAIIQSRYASVSVEQLEQSPASERRRGVVEEDLRLSGADQDPEVLESAKALLDAIANEHSGIAQSIGVSLEEVKSGSLLIDGVVSADIGVLARRLEVRDSIEIRNIKASDAALKKKAK